MQIQLMTVDWVAPEMLSLLHISVRADESSSAESMCILVTMTVNRMRRGLVAQGGLVVDTDDEIKRCLVCRATITEPRLGLMDIILCIVTPKVQNILGCKLM